MIDAEVVFHRDDWPVTWMRVARGIASRSRCVRSAVGCVIVTPDQRVVSTGYNGPPAGLTFEHSYSSCQGVCPRADSPLDSRDRTYHDCVAAHSEANALIRATFKDMQDGTLYVTRVPCLDCMKLVSNSGLARVVWCADSVELDSLRDVNDVVSFIINAGLAVTIMHQDLGIMWETP